LHSGVSFIESYVSAPVELSAHYFIPLQT